jgi:transcriptional regulator with XRE-family HTH domain
MFIFTKEMSNKLRQIRLNARLSQRELALALGFKKKSGQSYIARLEKGLVKNPTIRILLDYLRTCGESWSEFFKQLNIIDFKIRHEKMILQLPQPPESRKVHRAAIRYETGIEFPSKEKEEIDFDRLKKQIKNKVLRLVSKEEITLTPALSPNRVSRPEKGRFDHQGRESEAVITAYQKFAQEFFDFLAALNKPGRKMVVEKYQRAGFERHLLSKITKIVYSVIRAEIKRIEAKKPLPTAKQEKMAIGFTRYRIRMERIESEVHKLLCELGVQSGSGKFALYKDFARECYGILKRYYGKEPLAEKFQPIIKRWVKEGLKEDVLLKVRDVTIKAFTGK